MDSDNLRRSSLPFPRILVPWWGGPTIPTCGSVYRKWNCSTPPRLGNYHQSGKVSSTPAFFLMAYQKRRKEEKKKRNLTALAQRDHENAACSVYFFLQSIVLTHDLSIWGYLSNDQSSNLKTALPTPGLCFTLPV